MIKFKDLAQALILLIFACLLSSCSVVEDFNDAVDSSSNGLSVNKLFDEKKYAQVIDTADVASLIEANNQDAILQVIESYCYLDQEEEASSLIKRLDDKQEDIQFVITSVNILKKYSCLEALEDIIDVAVGKYDSLYSEMSDIDQYYYNSLLIENEDYQKAIDQYLALLDKLEDEEDKGVVYNNLAWAYSSISDYENTITYSKKSLETDPNDSVTLSNLGNGYYGLEQYEEAKTAYEESLKQDSKNSYAAYGLAKVAEKLELPNEALSNWLIYVALMPQDTDGWSNLYDLYKEQKNIEGRITASTALVGLNTTSSYYTGELLASYYESKQTEALNSALEVYRENTTTFEADRLYAETMYQVDKALGQKLYLSILKTPLWKDDYAMLMSDLYWLDEMPIFEKVFVQAKLKIGELEALKIASDLFYDESDYVSLKPISEGIIALDAKSPYGEERLAECYYDMSQYEQALIHYNKCEAFTENTEYVIQSQAECLIGLKRLKEAKSTIEKVLIKNPERAYAYVLRAQISAIEKQSERAISDLIKAFELSKTLNYVLDDFSEFEGIKNDKRFLPYKDEN